MPNDFSFKGPGEPAWPSQSRNGHEDFNPPVWGLTKRELYMIQIIKGLIISGAADAELFDRAEKIANEIIKRS